MVFRQWRHSHRLLPSLLRGVCVMSDLWCLVSATLFPGSSLFLHNHQIFQNAPQRMACRTFSRKEKHQGLWKSWRKLGLDLKLSFRCHLKNKLGLSDLLLEEPDLQVRTIIIIVVIHGFFNVNKSTMKIETFPIETSFPGYKSATRSETLKWNWYKR